MSGKVLVNTKFIETALTLQYTVPDKTNTLCDGVRVANDTALPVTVEINVVPFGGSAGPSNVLIPAVSVPAGGTTTVLSGLWMNAGDSIHAISSVLNALTMHIGGREFP